MSQRSRELIDGKPVKVVDLSWLQSLRGDEEFLANSARYMVPDALTRELLDKPGPGHLLKFRRILLRNPRKVLLGRYWSELSQRETVPGVGSALRDTVSDQDSRFQAMAKQPTSKWLEAFRATLPDSDPYERHRLQFQALRLQFAAWAQRQDDWTLAAGKPAQQIEWLRKPDQIATFAASSNPEKSSQEWIDALSVYPDVHALGRWVRLIAWSSFTQALAPESNLSNDWDDIHYAFLASYAGGLVTRDFRLASMVTAVFPHVDVELIRSA